ncbi:MAG: hypothetical protein IPM50_10265 [Acidobacteriota bacterium]|nr:MAG: hypothetical protein IPM50_10265 [Acidobacteriota bacterium]
MSSFIRISSLICIAIIVLASAASAQRAPKYSYAAQKKLIPSELGQVYLGMPLRDFAKQIDLSRADIEDDRFEEMTLQIPFDKGNIRGFTAKVAGFPVDGRDELLSEATAARKNDEGGEFEIEVKRLIMNKIPAGAFVYSITVNFKPEFDQKAWVTKTYGKGTVRDPKDEYHFSDIEWVKKTSDGLTWLIRSLHEKGERRLMLYGRIKGTEWELDVDN